jgi:hypothetical protein
MPHAIIRRENGRRHEVYFGDVPVRFEIDVPEISTAPLGLSHWVQRPEEPKLRRSFDAG